MDHLKCVPLSVESFTVYIYIMQMYINIYTYIYILIYICVNILILHSIYSKCIYRCTADAPLYVHCRLLQILHRNRRVVVVVGVVANIAYLFNRVLCQQHSTGLPAM